MVPIKELCGKDLMYCGKKCGPWFGGGSGDLGISDRCNQNYSSEANFPTSYNCEG